ncbi:MAG: hypothetical protein DRR08_22840 [Candidatus Parabeggiatoa sp. nov. 2]|nr:MAG: hypothetical protein B6247_08725 [Beggiatoa sp. 4572_84]RKZ55986.1 MAG: hypothetical protein DRR08_22840 [Gammaproteobacteria bacterium]HEC84879.1 hypothetical protein [Thioploca sp.]
MAFFSNTQELEEIKTLLSRYARLPFSSTRMAIPGAIVEMIIAYVKKATVLNTYDFVDIVNQNQSYGWQVKSTRESTPVTWKRAKIRHAPALIKESKLRPQGLQKLGDSIIEFCNEHALQSLKRYNLNEMGYARLIIHPNNKATYFERRLCTRSEPLIFKAQDFEWHWSTPKKTTKKEQLPALHGIRKTTGQKWWAWHGLGENQLHFSGEKNWWLQPGDNHVVTFDLPTKMSIKAFIELLSQLDIPD